MKATALEMAFFHGGGWFQEALGQLFCTKFTLIFAPPDACVAKQKSTLLQNGPCVQIISTIIYSSAVVSNL